MTVSVPPPNSAFPNPASPNQARSTRDSLKTARRVIIKVGSRVLSEDPDLPEKLAEQFANLARLGKSPILVSSGAVALGIERLALKSRPTEVAWLQAAASAGQSVLMRRYDEAFAKRGLVSAQVLLTHADLADRTRLNNARGALGALLEARAVPIINENDVVATEELRFSDNDQLSAMVAPLVGADALVLLTDVDGVLDENGARIAVMLDNSAFVDRGARPGGVGRGGMASKVASALKARRAGAAVVIANARRPEGISEIFEGKDVGTFFPPVEPVLRARQHWIAYTLRPNGTVVVDRGAENALRSGQASLLPVGVVGVRGDFHPGDSVRVASLDGVDLGRGLTKLGAIEVARAAGKKGDELALALGLADALVIHKDDFVLAD